MHKPIDHLSQAKGSLSNIHGFAYSLPVIGLAFLMGPIAILQGIYAKYFGMPLTTIATVLLIARLFDAISDPVIGFLSDRYYARTGSRKLFMVVGALLFIFSSYFLYVPLGFHISIDSPSVSPVYFLFWFILFYFAFTLFEVPHLAWGGELCESSQDKNRIYAWRSVATFLGSLFFFAMPLLPVFETSAFTPQTLRWSVIVTGCLIIPVLFFCMSTVPASGSTKINNSSVNTKSKPENKKSLLSSIIKNTPLLIFFAAFICAGIGVGMWFTLMFLYVESYLDLGEQFSLAYVISLAVCILTIGGWPILADRWSKQCVWIIATFMITTGIASTSLLSPSNTSQLALMLCMTTIYAGFAALNIMAPSILADIIDYGTWKFGTERAGTYFSLYTLMTKGNIAVGGALGLAIVGWYGFDATSVIHSSETVFGLRLAISWLPAPIVLLSSLFIALIPINAHRHTIIRRRLDTRTHRAASAMRLKDSASGELRQSKGQPHAYLQTQSS